MAISPLTQNKNYIIPFKANDNDKLITLQNLSDAQLYALANTSDKMLEGSARTIEGQKYLQDPMRKVEKKTSQAIPVFDTLISAALAPGDFGDKVFAGVVRAIEWGIFIKVTDTLNRKLNENENYRNFAQKHPVVGTLVSTLAISAVGILAYTGAKLGVNKLIEKHLPTKEYLEKVKQGLNKNSVGQKIAGFANKHRNGFIIGGTLGLIGVLGIAINSIAAFSKATQKGNEKADQLKTVRLEAAQELNNRLISRQIQAQEEM